MGKCKNCQCDCHCNNTMHLPEYSLDKGGACVCDNCECKNVENRAEDSTYENNGGVVIDDTEECESCQ